MTEQKEYVVKWSYTDSHHCNFSEELRFKGVNQGDILEQFKQTDAWKTYEKLHDPNAFEPKVFFYRIEEVRDLSSLVNTSE